MEYYHVDVFSDKPFTGNGLTVVFPVKNMNADEMLKITQEFRQFETIFIMPRNSSGYPVRIFTTEEELVFAGHPMIGAAAVLHEKTGGKKDKFHVRLLPGDRNVDLVSIREGGCCSVEMNQGRAEFRGQFLPEDISGIIAGLNLSSDDIHPGYPLETVTTGLPYLLLPVKTSPGKAEIISDRFEQLLLQAGAKFIYIFNPDYEGGIECRTWDNSGRVEDVATGSAAGPLCAYLVKNGYFSSGELIEINQGSFAGRPSVISGRVDSDTGEVFISGRVSFFAEGNIREPLL